MTSFYSVIKETPEKIKSLEIGKSKKDKVCHHMTLTDGKLFKIKWEDEKNYDAFFTLKKISLPNLENYYDIYNEVDIVDLSKSPKLKKAEISALSAFKYSNYLQNTDLKLQSPWIEDVQELKKKYPNSSVTYKHPMSSMIHISITPKTKIFKEQGSHHFPTLMNLSQKSSSKKISTPSTKKK